MDLVIHPVALKLKNTFETAHSKRDIQHSLLVELSVDGFSGYGEAAMNTYFGITIESINDDLELARAILDQYKWGSPEELHRQLSELPLSNNFALCALDEAAYDLYGKQHGLHTYQYLGSKLGAMPLSDYTIGIDTIDTMVEKMKAMPWPVYKIKLGTRHDIEIIKELRRHTQSVFRVDANCGWEVEQAIRNSYELANLGVEFIEQPLDPNNWDGMKSLRANRHYL